MELIRLSITERAEYCLCMSLNTQNPSTISLLRETNPLWIKKSENLTHSCNMQVSPLFICPDIMRMEIILINNPDQG
jgi:hypothetical protein